MTDKEIIALVMQMNRKGIQLNARYEPIGCQFALRPSDVVAYLKDRDSFFAHECGLDKETYQAWKQFMINGRRCGGPTKKGSCKRIAKNTKNLSPQEYARRLQDGSLRCAFHMADSRTT